MRYDPSVIQQVSSQNDIVEVISSHLTLKKAGKNFKGLCPFHNEKTPSFMVNPDRQIFHCFGCGANGDVIEFVRKIENLDFPETLEFLAKRANIELPKQNFGSEKKRSETNQMEKLLERALAYFRSLYKDQRGGLAREYMEGRQFPADVLEEFEVGYSLDEWKGLTELLTREGFRQDLMLKSGLIKRSEKGNVYDVFRGRVLFPIRNATSRLIGFGGRVISKEGTPKYLNSPETEWFKKGRELFGLNVAKKFVSKDNGRLFIVEGYMDCVRLHGAGIKNTAATLGTALTSDHVRLIRRYADEAILVFDGDNAGASAAFRSLDVFLEEGFPVKVLTVPSGMDPDDFVVEKGAEGFQELAAKSKDFFDYKLSLLRSQYSGTDSMGLLKITSSLLEVLAKMNNEILQSHYLHKLSNSLQIDETSLRSELAKLKGKMRPNQQNMEKNQLKSAPSPSIPLSKEEVLLLFLLSLEEGDKQLDRINPGYFQSDAAKQALELLTQICQDQPPKARLPLFLSGLKDEGLKKKITELSFMDWESEDLVQALNDCVLKIENAKREAKIKALEAKIRLAEEQGQTELLTQYLKDFQELSLKGK